MVAVKHLTKRIQGDYRLIVIGDIHGHLDRFRALLKKVKYDPNEDYLVILGDFVEKGDQVIETMRFVRHLSTYEKCYVLMGNCEWALAAMLTIPELAVHIPDYLEKVSKNGAIRDIYHQEHLYDGHETRLGIQRVIEHKLHQDLQFIIHLPTTLKLNDFIFVHAGLEDHKSYKEGRFSSYLEMQGFYNKGHHYKETVITGHIPTANYDPYYINNDILIDHEKRIICVDGGSGVKPVSQLNALIIQSINGQIGFEKENVRLTRKVLITKDCEGSTHCPHKVSFPDYEVELIEKGDSFSLCRLMTTDEIFPIKNEFLYTKGKKLYCLDDYTDYFLPVKEGEIVDLIGHYGDVIYALKGQMAGWIPAKYTKLSKFPGLGKGNKK